MKKLICILLCLFMIASVFTGCGLIKNAGKPKTYREAAQAGMNFIKSEGLKNVKITASIEGDGFTGKSKAVLEGKYDPIAKQAVLSVGVTKNGSTVSLDDEIILNGQKLYIRVPDASVIEKISGAFSPEEKYPVDDGGRRSISLNGDGFASLYGKYLVADLPEKDRIKTVIDIFDGLINNSYEKGEKLEKEEDYPYVVKYSFDDTFELFSAAFESIRDKKSDLIGEIDSLIKEYIGAENYEAVNDKTGAKLTEHIAGFIDSLNRFTDKRVNEPEKFDLTAKIAYEKNKKFEYVLLYDVEQNEQRGKIKVAATVTAAEKDDGFADKFSISAEKQLDFKEQLQEYVKNALIVTDAEKIIGLWSAKYDMSKFLVDMFAAQSSMNIDTSRFKDLYIDFIFEFNDDSTLKMYVDDSKFDDFFTKMKSIMKVAIVPALQENLKEYGLTLDEYLNITGRTMDDIIDEAYPDSLKQQMKDSFEIPTKNYKVEEGKLFSLDGELPESYDMSYIEYEFINDNTLVLKKYVIKNEAENSSIYNLFADSYLFPMTLERIR